MPRQLSDNKSEIRDLVWVLDEQQHALDSLILREPTGVPREELTSANTHLMSAINHLKEVCGS